MQSRTVLLFVLICMTTLYMTKADKDMCMCVCCNAGSCKSDFAWFKIEGCTDASCAEHCPGQYVDCRPPAEASQSMCMNGGLSFSQHATWGAFILACVVSTIFRI